MAAEDPKTQNEIDFVVEDGKGFTVLMTPIQPLIDFPKEELREMVAEAIIEKGKERFDLASDLRKFLRKEAIEFTRQFMTGENTAEWFVKFVEKEINNLPRPKESIFPYSVDAVTQRLKSLHIICNEAAREFPDVLVHRLVITALKKKISEHKLYSVFTNCVLAYIQVNVKRYVASETFKEALREELLR